MRSECCRRSLQKTSSPLPTSMEHGVGGRGGGVVGGKSGFVGFPTHVKNNKLMSCTPPCKAEITDVAARLFGVLSSPLCRSYRHPDF